MSGFIDTKNLKKYSFESIGTLWNIYFDNENSKLIENIKNICNIFEHRFSRFLTNSEVSQIKNKVGYIKASHELIKILKIYQKFFLVSDSKFTPLIGVRLEDLGYDENYTFQPQKQLREIPNFLEIIKIISNNEIFIRVPISLDFGGIGKGYLIEKIYKYLTNKCNTFIIDASGDIKYFDIQKRLLRVGLKSYKQNKIIGYSILKSKFSIHGSSNHVRKWLTHSHIIDPLTNKSNLDIEVWVLGKNSILCDFICKLPFLSFEKENINLAFPDYEVLITT